MKIASLVFAKIPTNAISMLNRMIQAHPVVDPNNIEHVRSVIATSIIDIINHTRPMNAEIISENQYLCKTDKFFGSNYGSIMAVKTDNDLEIVGITIHTNISGIARSVYMGLPEYCMKNPGNISMCIKGA